MILVTGGAGYIGSHTCLELIKAGFDIVVIDNLCNSNTESLLQIQKLTGKNIQFINGDIRDAAMLETVFHYPIEAVIHFAGLKSISESIENPISYYENNVQGSLVLLQAMRSHNVKTIVFSSSASVYGAAKVVPIREDSPLAPSSPYARSKLIIENILHDLFLAEKDWKIAILRYFNPVGAHESGTIGECHFDAPSNLMPYIAMVAQGILPELKIFGDDYLTVDGTGVRDYVHVVDLAIGHIKALKALKEKNGIFTVNLGTGSGYSVLEMLKAFEQINSCTVPYKIVERRVGDVASSYADVTLAEKTIGWRATHTLEDMCRSSCLWQQNNATWRK